MLYASSQTIAIIPQSGSTTDSLTGVTSGKIYSPLKVTVLFVRDENGGLCLVSAPFYADFYPLSNLLRARLGAALGLERERIAIFSSHNHSCVYLSNTSPSHEGFSDADETLREDQLTAEGHELLEKLLQACTGLPSTAVPVRLAWGLGHERRISYNRKGRRADGSTYFIREEDRANLGVDFNGDIDDNAPILAFLGDDGKPVALLVQFTAHPVTAFHPEQPSIFGDYAQVACDDLSEHFGGVPVAFLQGCAGETNSKGLLAAIPADQKVADATRYGHLLGQTYIGACRDLQPCARDDLDVAWRRITLPFGSVPPADELRTDIEEMEAFLHRCSLGEENTRTCCGLNFPSTLSPKYRANLIKPCLRWTRWALALHDENKRHEAATSVEVEIGVFRIGDVGIVGLPVEPFLGIGRRIRDGSALPLTIPCGYMNDNIGYVPDSPNLGDRDYSSSYYRYTNGFLPFAPPGGDLLADGAVQELNRMAAGSTRVSNI